MFLKKFVVFGKRWEGVSEKDASRHWLETPPPPFKSFPPFKPPFPFHVHKKRKNKYWFEGRFKPNPLWFEPFRTNSERPAVRVQDFLSQSIASNVESCAQVRSSQVFSTRVNPEFARETAVSKVQKLEQALQLMSDFPGPAVDLLKQELEKARAASQKPPINVEVEQCRKFIARAEKRVALASMRSRV